MNEVWLIRATYPHQEEAMQAARLLLAEKLVACANISAGTTALYHWEGMIQQEQEVIVLLKTTKAKIEPAMARIKELHSYQIPAIVAWQATLSDVTYAAWVFETTA